MTPIRRITLKGYANPLFLSKFNKLIQLIGDLLNLPRDAIIYVEITFVNIT
jgi:hypothetical protein